MAKQSLSSVKKSNNGLLMCVFGVLLVLIIVAIIIIVVLNNKPNPNSNQAFFETNDSQYVITTEFNPSDEGSALSSHDVYYLDGEKVTGHETYYEFANEDAASVALSNYKDTMGSDEGFVSDIKLDGKYIVIVATPEQYDNLTLEFIKQWSEIDVSELEDLPDDTGAAEAPADGSTEVVEVQEETVEVTPGE